MKILALEFSSPRRSVAVADLGEAGKSRLLAELVDEVGGTRGPLAMVEEALTQSGVGREEIQTIVVGLGPGSYTGIRMAIALAQGWQLGRQVQLRGVSSADAMAHHAWLERRRGMVNVGIDAQRGDYYLGAYELTEHAACLVEPMRIASREVVEMLIAQGGVVLVPEAPAAVSGCISCFPTAADLTHIACEQPESASSVQLEPIYLRPVAFAKAPPVTPLPQ